MLRGSIVISLVVGLAGQLLAQSGDTAEGDATVACQTAGYDLILMNSGEVALPEGTELGWAVRFARAEGVHTLNRALEPGERIVIVAATDPSYLTTDTPCTVEIR